MGIKKIGRYSEKFDCCNVGTYTNGKTIQRTDVGTLSDGQNDENLILP